MISLGIVTYNRPEYAEKCIKAAVKQLEGSVDRIYVHNDGSDTRHKGAYERAYKPLKGKISSVLTVDTENHGVAHAKNELLRKMLKDGADHLFLCEDDIIVQTSHAISGYVNASLLYPTSHLSFAHHGPANAGGAVETDDLVQFFPHSVGAWTYYNSACLKNVGLFDENMYNAFEHVEHDLRLFQAGFTPRAGAHRFPDAYGSWAWLKEIPGSIEKSSIRPRADWSSNIRKSLTYWRDNKPETFEMMFGEGMPLRMYAKSIIG